MSLDGALGISNGGLANIALGLSVISQNVANASTPQYAVETATQISLSGGGQESGVLTGLVVRATDPGLQAEVGVQTADAAASGVTSSALSSLEPVLGTVGSGNDLGSQLTAVQSAFTALLADPADPVQQGAVVQAAGSLAQGINTLSQAYGGVRQTAETAVVTGVAQLGTALANVGRLNTEIVAQKAQGLSVADLQNQRAQAENTITQLVGARFVDQPNGSTVVLTSGGTQLPTDGSQTLSVTPATMGTSVYYPGGGIGGIMLGGTDITAQLAGGSIGANLVLRDQTMPRYQAGLDQFAQTMSSRFAGQGLSLFTDGAGNVPASTGPSVQSGYVGYAGEIQVNPAVLAQPSLVRDGTQAVSGSATGASAFTPNPAGGPAGFSAMISRVLTFALGADAQEGVPQAAVPSGGLGPAGNLQTGYPGAASLGDAANALTASQASDSAAATSQASETQAVATSLQAKLTGATGVDMDTELGQMVILQNAYGANAKIITTIQTLYQDVLNMVTT